jgi:hypothetical protein
MHQMGGDRENRDGVPDINRPKIAVMGFGSCGINLIHDLDKILGTRDDVVVAGFQRKAFDFVEMSPLRMFYWDDNVIYGRELTMPENFERIDKSLIEVEKKISGVDMLIIVAGLGGLTGSYASVKIAQLFEPSHTKVMAFVVTPFSAEGQRKFNPNVCLTDLDKLCDVVAVASNNKLIEVAPRLSLNTAFAMTRSLFEQMVGKVLDAGSENSDLVLDDPNGLVNIHINRCSLGELDGKRVRIAIDREIERLKELKGRIDEPIYNEGMRDLLIELNRPSKQLIKVVEEEVHRLDRRNKNPSPRNKIVNNIYDSSIAFREGMDDFYEKIMVSKFVDDEHAQGKMAAEGMNIYHKAIEGFNIARLKGDP